jgi:hypothetical protein
MPRNLYFSQGVPSEQALYEDIIIEGIKMYGFEVYYLPRNMVTRDMILNEDIESKFDGAYLIEMYIENVDGWDGDGTLFSKFGLEIRNQATFVVAKRQWEKLVGLWNNGIISNRPAEGDLLYFPLTKSFFEIKFVEHQSPFYQLNKFPTYKLQCELFEYNNEDVNTGVKEVDTLQLKFATEYVFDIENGNGTKFKIGEKVTQVLVPGTVSTPAVEIYGKVLRFEQASPTDVLKIYLGEVSTNTGKYNKFQVTSGPTDILVGQTSGAEWNITRCYNIQDADIDRTFVNNDQQAQNLPLELEGNSVIDFSESNPFGEPNQL